MSVTAQRGEDDLLLPGLAAGHRLADRGGDRVGRLRSRHDALGLGEVHGGGEALDLRDGDRLGEPKLVDVAHERRHAVVAETAGVDRVGDERVPEGVHLHERGHAGGVAEVVAILALGEARQAAGSTQRMVGFMRPAIFSRRNGNARPPKLEPPPVQPTSTSGVSPTLAS